MKVISANFPGVFSIRTKAKKYLATRNISPGTDVYGEKLIIDEGREYRLWNPYRSKLSAAIQRGLLNLPIKPEYKILYLGAASGTTVSHISDIIGSNGHIYCVEFAHRPLRRLINRVGRFRTNISPIAADARFPESYRTYVEIVDTIYCDIAQPDQTKILIRNADLYLKHDGWILQAIKARSINSTLDPTKIFNKEISFLKREGYRIEEIIHLNPFDKDHVMILGQIEQ
jgi:fibrillarin-like pre-rRNA processing protein